LVRGAEPGRAAPRRRLIGVPLIRGTERRAHAVLLGLLLAAFGCRPAWPRYEAPDNTFSVELPPPLRTDAERIEGNQRLLAVESPPAEDQAFLVQRRRPAAGRHLEAEGVLDGFCAEFARARGYDITTDARGKRRDGRPAQTCAFHGPQLETRIQVVAA